MAQHPPKECFGKSWDPNNVACRGGNDPAYLHPTTGTNKRDPCAWFNPCATRVTAVKQQQQLIPAQQIVRRQQPQQPQMPQMPQMPQQPQAAQPTSPWGPLGPVMNTLVNRYMPQGAAPYPPQPYPQQQQQQLYQQPQQMMMPQQMAHPSMATVPYAVPMNYQAPGAQMSGYLTIPEPVLPGQHWGARLFLNVARSMAKASGHTVANFFDHTPINPWPTPPTAPNK
jgi:hypothetical protein